MTQFRYPPTPTGEDIEREHTIDLADPCRWLEQSNEQVRQWQHAQNQFTNAYLDRWPHRAHLRREVERYYFDRVGALPLFAGGKWFRAGRNGADKPCLIVSEEPFGEGNRLEVGAGQNGPFGISWIAPSPQGSFVAVGLCTDASENNRIALIDMTTGAQMPNPPPQMLMDAWVGGASWLPDESGFYYLALEGDPRAFDQGMMFHDMRSGHQSRPAIPVPDAEPSEYTLIETSLDGRWSIAHRGLFAPKPVALLDRSQPGAVWRPFITLPEVSVAGFVDGDRLIAVTDAGAPHGRVVSVDLEAADPNDLSLWRDLVEPQPGFVFRTVKRIGNLLYVTGYADTYSEMRVYDMSGAYVQTVPCPEPGAIAEPYFTLMHLIPSTDPGAFYFMHSSPRRSWGVYRHQPGAVELETMRAPDLILDNVIIEDYAAISHDGVRVPYQVVRLADAARPTPSLLYAYGAFNLAFLPDFPGPIAALIEAGGAYVIAHIRGGAELGFDWWRAGRMKAKQNCYHDLYAVAEDLVARGLTLKGKLAMMGRSNGGLMAGVAAMQRPDLWAAIVSLVPISDLLGMLRDPYGRYVLANEFADPTDPEEIVRLSQFSPYHLVCKGGRYPPIFVDAGAADPRCPPWQSRKFVARLQNDAASEAPALLRVRDNAGHGPATPKAIQLDGYADWLGFVMTHLGLTPRG